MTVVLHRLGPNDWKRFRAVRLASLRDAPEAFASTYEEWERADEPRWRARLTEVPFTAIAAIGDRDVGTVSATQPNEAGYVLLISMWVAPDARGTGVGDALVDAVVAWASEAGNSVELDVREANAPAITLYERHGFRDAGAIDGDPPERRMRR